MVSATGQTHLMQRGNIFYFRIAIPLGLRPILGKDFNLSLRTSERRKAARICRRMSNGAEYFFYKMAEREPTDKDINGMQRTYFQKYMRQLRFDHEDVKAMFVHERLGPSTDDPYGFIENAKEELQSIKPTLQLDSYDKPDHEEAAEMLRKRDFDSFYAAELAPRLVQSRMEAHRIKLAYLEEDYDAITIKHPALKGSQNAFLEGDQKYSVPLEECMERYLRSKQDDVTPKSLGAVKAILDKVAEVIGPDTPIGQVQKQPHGVLLEEVIPKIPAHYGRDYKAKGRSLMSVIEDGGDYPVIQDKAIGMMWTYTHQFFEWAETREYILKNPVKGLKPKFKKKGKKEAPSTKRKSFTTEQQHLLFNSAIYRGRRNPIRSMWERGDHIIRDGYFWLPLIANFTGMREGEILQLTINDFHYENGIYYLDVNEECEVEGRDKHVKTVNSVRIVPIHPELVKIGLPQFIEERRKEIKEGESLLGKGITIPKNQEMIKNYSRNFGEYTVRVGIRDSKNNKEVFHSFRNTIHDAFKRAGVSGLMATWIAGHEQPDDTETIGDRAYVSHRPSLEVLYETICKVKYDVDLSHLYPKDE